MREETKMKQCIIGIALILLFCGYYITPQKCVKTEERIETSPGAINDKMLHDEEFSGIAQNGNIKILVASPADSITKKSYLCRCFPKK